MSALSWKADGIFLNNEANLYKFYLLFYSAARIQTLELGMSDKQMRYRIAFSDMKYAMFTSHPKQPLTSNSRLRAWPRVCSQEKKNEALDTICNEHEETSSPQIQDKI